MENTKERILSLLEHARGDSRSGQQMAEQLGVTRAAVWKAIDQLKKEGHRIEAVNNRGYCLPAGKRRVDQKRPGALAARKL